MQKFNKAMLVPLLSAIALILKYVLNIDIPDGAVDLIADLILGSLTLTGMFVHMFDKKDGGAKDEPTQHFNGGGPAV